MIIIRFLPNLRTIGQLRVSKNVAQKVFEISYFKPVCAVTSLSQIILCGVWPQIYNYFPGKLWKILCKLTFLVASNGSCTTIFQFMLTAIHHSLLLILATQSDHSGCRMSGDLWRNQTTIFMGCSCLKYFCNYFSV